jgi:hypothetical protein
MHSFIIKSMDFDGLKTASPWVTLFLDVQMVYITEIILAISFSGKREPHKMSLAQVEGCNLGSFTNKISFATAQNICA